MYHGCRESDPHALYAHAVEGLNAFPLAYILLTEPRWSGSVKAAATADEIAGARKVLNAAALTYVAAFVTSLLMLLYWAYRLGLFGRNNN